MPVAYLLIRLAKMLSIFLTTTRAIYLHRVLRLLPHSPARADKSEGRGVGADWGGRGERTRMMKGKKRKEGANTRKKLQLQIGLFFVSHIDQSFAA